MLLFLFARDFFIGLMLLFLYFPFLSHLILLFILEPDKEIG